MTDVCAGDVVSPIIPNHWQWVAGGDCEIRAELIR